MDNASFNNICVMKIIKILRQDLNAYGKRLWCIRNIINFITKAFLFNNKLKSLKADFAIINGINDLKGAMKLWKKQEAICKLHNLICCFHTSPQCKELFMNLAEVVSCTQDTLNKKIKNLYMIDDNKTG